MSVIGEDNNQYILRLSKHIIDERRQTGQKNNDFIQLLIEAKAGEQTDKETETSDVFLNEGTLFSMIIFLTYQLSFN